MASEDHDGAGRSTGINVEGAAVMVADGEAVGRQDASRQVRAERRAGRSCGGCRFWEQADLHGHCKRHAPTVVAPGGRAPNGTPSTFTAWPRVPGEQWCGEWAADEGAR